MPQDMDKPFAFGSNGSRQLGLKHNDDTAIPEEVDLRLTSIKQVAAGGNHTLILSQDGIVQSHGSSTHGQCAYSHFCELESRTHGSPRCDSTCCSVNQISATWSASMFLCRDGSISTCGEGLSGELGLGHGLNRSDEPRQIPDFPPTGIVVVQIVSSLAHTVAVLSNGEVWGWGRGRQGQLGEPAENNWSPRRIEGIPFPVVKAVCGKDFTCVIGDRYEGRILVLGLTKHDRFGLVSSIPPAIPGWEDIAASWGSIFILRERGALLGFGRNDHGQVPPSGLPPIEAIAAGSEHCVALSKTGKVLAWGWGEHGNCGEPTNSDGDVKGRWNEIDTGYSVKAVFAGCATTFVVTAHYIAQH